MLATGISGKENENKAFIGLDTYIIRKRGNAHHARSLLPFSYEWLMPLLELLQLPQLEPQPLPVQLQQQPSSQQPLQR